MQILAEIPLLIKETLDANYIQNETENFIKGIGNSKGIVIINSPLPSASSPAGRREIDFFRFTTGKNISIIVL